MTRVRTFHAVLCAAALLALMLILAPAGLCAPVEATFTASPEAVFIEDDPFAGVDLAAGYIASRMPGTDDDLPLLTPRNLGEDLGGLEKRIYDWMRPEIIKVAKGERASTEFLIPVEDVLDKLTFTKDDLGVNWIVDASNGNINPEALAMLDYDSRLVLHALRHDLPYEMYWCDPIKGSGGIVTGYSLNYSSDGETLDITGSSLCFALCVSQDYAVEGSLDYNSTLDLDVSFTMNTSYGTSVAAAAENAAGIVADHVDELDHVKLASYKDAICELTSYNDPAASENYEGTYGNPWQLVWVFDGDDETTVVCEGYSKAFQYLCDLTDFDDKAITVITVTGVTNERHMWNIAHMDDGENYLVDVTNCDEGTVGAPDKLFLKGYASGSVTEGYVFNGIYGSTISYVYDKDLPFGEEELTLSANDYTPVQHEPVSIDETNFPDSIFRTWVLQNADRDSEGDEGYGELSYAEICAMTDMDVSGLAIADLTGLGYFSRLQSLDASDNHLTALDLSGIGKLTASSVKLSGQTIPDAGSVSIELIGDRYVADIAPVVQCFDGLSGIEFVGAVLDPETNKPTYTRLPKAVTVTRGTGLAGAKLGIDFPVAYAAPDRYCGELDVPLDIQAAMHIGYIPEGDSYVVTVFGPNAYDGTDPIYNGTNGVIRFTPKQPGLTTFGIRANGSGEADTVNVRVFATGAGAFRLPDGMTAIGGSAFADDESIEEVLIPNGQTAIGANAFAGCAGLRLVWMPEDVTSIDAAAFGSVDANGKPIDCPDLTFCCPNGGTAAAWADAHKVPHFFLDPEP